MVTLSSLDALAAAMARGRNVTLGTYVLHPGRLMRAIESAAHKGVRIHVRVEAHPYRNRGAATANADAVARLRAEGVDAVAVDGLHFKGAVVDGRLYLDDRNWTDDGGDTVLRDDDARDVRQARAAIVGADVRSTARLAVTKRDALAMEDAVIERASSRTEIDVETEAFSFGPRVYATLAHAARAGHRVRLLVDSSLLAHDPRERAALADLERDGVEVRAVASTEKFAVAGRRAWVGSANATFGVAEQRDWGIATRSRAVVARIHQTFVRRWSGGKAVLLLPTRGVHTHDEQP